MPERAVSSTVGHLNVPVDVTADLDLQAVDWMREGACVGANPEIFFDERDWGFYYPTAEALAVCRTCPVTVTCLDFALKYKPVGTWGGTSDYQRRALRRGIKRQKCPICEGRTLAVLVSVWDYPTLAVCIGCGMSWDGPPGSRPASEDLTVPA